ncbi:MAG: SRPBCC domain-containing protein [Micropruina glycogenica]
MTEPLVITRLVPATPEQLWLAWTTEPGLATWWWHTWPDTRYRVNARVGGEYRIEAADHGFGVRGTFEVVEAPSRLVFSWVWYELADGVASEEPDDQVQVVFTPHPNGTLQQLTHTGPWTDDEAAENYRQGWTFVLDALAGTGASG